jgi:tetratricopeptide (TPR) repeat protein
MGTKGRRRKKITSRTKTGSDRNSSQQNSRTKKAFGSFFSKTEREQKPAKEIEHAPIKGLRLWIFRGIAITVIPVLFLLLLEVSLRIIGYGFNPNMTFKHTVKDVPSYLSNIQFAWRFFPPAIARAPNPFIFPQVKSDNTYRIFILGASAAAGTPDGAFSFGRILQVMLSQMYPQANFEVITTAMPAINSHVVLTIAEDCTRYKSDLFIVYLGNNEVVGPYGAGTVFSPLSANRSLIRLGIAIKATKLGQLMTNVLGSLSGGGAPQVWRGLQMFLDKQVRAGDESLKVVYSHFHDNLQDIRNVAAKNGIKIIFSTVPGNLKDNPPFASLHRPDITDAQLESFDELYQKGIDSEEDENYAQALQLYSKTAEIDDNFADLQFRMGRCYWLTGDYEQAKNKYIMARELDTLRFRADNKINKTIRDIASDRGGEGVYLVDALKVFQEKSPHETPGHELFYEHVHMNFTGNYLLADSVYEQVEKILPERIKRFRTDKRTLPTEAECAQYLAYNDWDRYDIADKVLNDFIKQPPFNNQLYQDQRVMQMEHNIKGLKVRLSPEKLNEIDSQYQWAIEQTPSDIWLRWKYALFLEFCERYDDALRQYHLVLNDMPHHYESYAKIGFISGVMGDLDSAVSYSLKAVSIYPSFAEAYFNLGLAYQFKNQMEDAIEAYKKSIRFMPDQSQAYNNLGLVLYQLGRREESFQAYHEGLEIMPDNLNLHYNYGLLLKDYGRTDDAVKELQAALEIDPNSEKTQKALRATMYRQN